MSKRALFLCLSAFVVACTSDGVSDGAPRVGAKRLPLAQDLDSEIEPNGTAAAATAIANDTVVRAPIFGTGDVDVYSFQAGAGDRVYAATMTAFSASGSFDSQLRVLAADGTTELELDDDDGTLGALSSSIAGTLIPADGTYFVSVKHVSPTGSNSNLRPYDLHFRVQGDAPTAEIEPNDDVGTAQALPASGFVTGATSAGADIDVYSISLDAGDTLYAAVDFDPERDVVEWNGTLSVGMFSGGLLTVNDVGASTPDSEALFETVKTSGTYFVVVASSGGFGTYHLSVSVHPGAAATADCTTYTSTGTPVVIPDGPGQIAASIIVPGSPRVADLDVTLALTHAAPADLDVQLTSPNGDSVGLFSDVGSPAEPSLDLILDDEAAHPISSFAIINNMVVQPELNYRLHWFDGVDAGGTWTLTVFDDTAANGGTLTAFSLTICRPAPTPACAETETSIFASDFESDDGGFTHGGTQDEWERGTPSFGAITTCNGGARCWKTDLDGSYNASASTDLVSAPIDLSALSPSSSIRLSWAMKYQIESASFDHASVDIRHVDDTSSRRLFEFLDATMTNTIGNPAISVQEAAGWSLHTADVSEYAGSQVELVFHLDTDTSVQLAGMAIDDVSVTACGPVCGNGVVETGEDCDHGAANGQAGDCCSATCSFELVTTECRAAVDACDVAELCDGAGACPVDAPATNGTSCDDGDLCTLSDTCQSGNCTGTMPVVCSAVDSCHAAGSCNPSTGMCSTPNQTDGTACDDGDLCTLSDTCQSGNCTGAMPVVCTATEPCHTAGSCNPSTGECSTDHQSDGTACGVAGLCQSGVCEEPVEPGSDDDAGAGGQTDVGTDAGTAGGGAAGGAAVDGSAGGAGSGDAGPDASTEPASDADSGCGCGVPGRSRPAAPALALAALVLAGLLRRRRRPRSELIVPPTRAR